MEIYKLAFKNIRRKKLRSALTMLGIIIGTATIVSLLGIASGSTSAMEDQTSAYMYDIIVTPSATTGSQFLDPSSLSKLEKSSGLYDIKETTSFQYYIKEKMVTITGINNWKEVDLKQGHQGVVITSTMAKKLSYSIGSKIKIKNQTFAITGISSKDQFLVYLDQKTAKNLSGNKISAVTARTKMDPKKEAGLLKKQINDIAVLTKSEQVQKVQKNTDNALFIIGVIAGISLLVGIISVVNTMLMSVMERTRELGVLKAIGFTNREIKWSILLESGFLGFISSIIGVILGIAGILFVASTTDFMEYLPQMMPLWLIGGSIIGATVLSVLAGLYPAIHASRLNVVEALRNE